MPKNALYLGIQTIDFFGKYALAENNKITQVN
jgi:hypothetical protein